MSKTEEIAEVFKKLILSTNKAYEEALEKLQIIQTEIDNPFQRLTVEMGINLFSELKTRNESLYFEVNKLLAA